MSRLSGSGVADVEREIEHGVVGIFRNELLLLLLLGVKRVVETEGLELFEDFLGEEPALVCFRRRML